MTMQHQIHPDDERLAALAGGDADALADASLRAHVSGCDRCGPMVTELQQLRSVLAELPDLVPSRPLQLLPPAPTPREASPRGWLRRLAAPMMAAGAGLVLVGAIGTSGVVSNLAMGLGGAAGASAGSAAGGQPPADRGFSGGASQQPVAAPSTSGGQFGGEVSGGSAPPSERTNDNSTDGKASQGEGAFPGLAGGREAAETVRISPWAVVLLVGVLFLFAGGTLLVVKRPAGP